MGDFDDFGISDDVLNELFYLQRGGGAPPLPPEGQGGAGPSAARSSEPLGEQPPGFAAQQQVFGEQVLQESRGGKSPLVFRGPTDLVFRGLSSLPCLEKEPVSAVVLVNPPGDLLGAVLLDQPGVLPGEVPRLPTVRETKLRRRLIGPVRRLVLLCWRRQFSR